MTFITMLTSIVLMFVCNWLHFSFAAHVFLGVFVVTLLEIVITDAVAAGIKKAREQENK